MENVTLDKLKKLHGDNAESVYREIADKGGFGAVGHGEGAVPLNYEGGLDIRGVLDPNNTAITEASKNRIAELAGADRKEVEERPSVGSADKMNKGKEK